MRFGLERLRGHAYLHNRLLATDRSFIRTYGSDALSTDFDCCIPSSASCCDLVVCVLDEWRKNTPHVPRLDDSKLLVSQEVYF